MRGFDLGLASGEGSKRSKIMQEVGSRYAERADFELSEQTRVRSRVSNFNENGNQRQDDKQGGGDWVWGRKALLTIHGGDYDGRLREGGMKRKTGYILRVYVQEVERCSYEKTCLGWGGVIRNNERKEARKLERRSLLGQQDFVTPKHCKTGWAHRVHPCAFQN